jgi:hypothetical protein
MSVPTLSPRQQTSIIVLPSTGSTALVTEALPYALYTDSDEFLSGAAQQVTYTYRKLGGDILDIELTAKNVYAAYEEAVLEYSYLVNIHQAKNSLSNVLGNTTSSFDYKGEMMAGALSSSLSGSHIALKYPKFDIGYARRVSENTAYRASIGGTTAIYSASIDTTQDQQDYDLQSLISASSALTASLPYSGKVGHKKILINKVYYRSPESIWRFFGYYGGLNVVGDFHNYGQYADDSTFEVIPTWQNKLQAMAYEDHLYTRTSHYSYEIRNNNLRLFPIPTDDRPGKVWVEFSIAEDAWETSTSTDIGIDGVNNINTMPLANVPYESINSIGKQWIRRFALALTKEILGQVRSKFASVPIPGESITLNGPALISEGREEQTALRDELKTVLDELTYNALSEQESNIMTNANEAQKNIPNLIYVG